MLGVRLHMNERQRQECKRLRAFSSGEAADYLLANYGAENPNYGKAFLLLSHRSWKRSDQVRLARHYFRKIPFASAKPYAVFAAFMSLPRLIGLLEEFAPVASDKLSLFRYYVGPVLSRRASNDQEVSLVQGHLRRIAALGSGTVVA